MQLSPFLNERKAFFAKSAALALVLVVGVSYFNSRYLITFDRQAEPCFEWRLFIVDTQNKTPKRNDLVAFRARGMQPALEDGELAVKQAVGMPGDTVEVSETVTRINDQPRFRSGLYLLDKLDGRSAADFTRVLQISEGNYFGMGSMESSFDSRYWGFIHADQVVGVAVPIY
ncbi:signal peptidase I [Marinobacter goseongensis]|uniref:signal peptidase I n=1 Tax=Marinobacter goseongensis TaxID=453838 RepID=UPI002006D5EE|nr:signal peptidase I [Marinobacter goseongensis]MCK7553313.1 signal peptidase I [Marinobacter goseongensis]